MFSFNEVIWKNICENIVSGGENTKLDCKDLLSRCFMGIAGRSAEVVVNPLCGLFQQPRQLESTMLI